MVDDDEPASVRRPDRPRRLSWPRPARPEPTPRLTSTGGYQELQARYRGIIDRLPAVLYIDGVDDGDTMVDVGPGIVDLLGMTREEWLATSEGWRDVLHPDDLDRIVEASERTVRPASRSASSTARSIATDTRCGSAKRRSSSTTRTATRSSGSA
jgi:PAS domain-containing protein